MLDIDIGMFVAGGSPVDMFMAGSAGAERRMLGEYRIYSRYIYMFLSTKEYGVWVKAAEPPENAQESNVRDAFASKRFPRRNVPHR